MRRRRQNRREGHALISEFTAALCLMLPLAAATCLVVVEMSQAYMIHGALHQSALTAARRLAIAYGQNRAATLANPDAIFSTVRYLNIVNDNSQFTIPDGSLGWNTTSNPPTITVLCTYHSNAHGCPPFPNPDPLNLGNLIVLQSQATCRLE